MKSLIVAIQMKAIEQHFSVVLYKMALTFECVEEILKCEQLRWKILATEQPLPVVLFILLYKVVLPFESVDKFLKYNPFYSGSFENF